MTTTSIAMEQNLYWFNFGLMSVALLLGVLVGASQSPVAGVAITAAFGVVAAFLGVWQKSAIEKKLGAAVPSEKTEANEQANSAQLVSENVALVGGEVRNNLNSLGRMMFLFCTVFVLGLVAGAYIRVEQWPKREAAPKTFPWANSEAPKKIEDAIDWIVVQDRLLEGGFSQIQINSLYAHQLAEWKEDPPGRDFFSKKRPLSTLLSGAPSALQPGIVEGLVAQNPSKEKDGRI